MSGGIIYGMPAVQYHADEGVSNSMLSDMHKSAAHCYAMHHAPHRPERKATPAMLVGTLAHAAVLEPGELGLRYVARPAGLSFATKEGKAWRAEQTRIVIDPEDLDTAMAQKAAVRSVPVLRDLMANGRAESSLFWNDDATRLRCRARPDWLAFGNGNHVTCLDLKTTSDVSPSAVARTVATYGYHRQAAHYTNGLRACGFEVDAFVFAFVTNAYPFLSVAYVLDDDAMEQGREEVCELLALYANCKEYNTWPAYGDGYQSISLPVWARRTEEMEIEYV